MTALTARLRQARGCSLGPRQGSAGYPLTRRLSRNIRPNSRPQEPRATSPRTRTSIGGILSPPSPNATTHATSTRTTTQRRTATQRGSGARLRDGDSGDVRTHEITQGAQEPRGGPSPHRVRFINLPQPRMFFKTGVGGVSPWRKSLCSVSFPFGVMASRVFQHSNGWGTA